VVCCVVGRASRPAAGVHARLLVTPGSDSQAITTGPDGALWFVEAQGSGNGKIGRVTTTGVFNEYTLPTSYSQPSGMRALPRAA
jgi:virginiamycin B lyase